MLNAQSPDQNYIKKTTYLDDKASQSIEEIQYFDGLGRPVQTVQKGITPARTDLVTYQEYDPFGRESNSWLPTAVPNNNGNFMPLPTLSNLANRSYGDATPYARPVYEDSPLNRILEQYGPGQRWQNAGKSVKTNFLTNTSTGELACRLYTTTDNRNENRIDINITTQAVPLTTTVRNEDGTTREVVLTTAGMVLTTRRVNSATSYEPAQLYVTQMQDEQGNTSYEFKDKLGQVVLTRQVNGGEMHDTYYVYDSFGNLRAVLPPLVQDKLTSGDNLDEHNLVLRDYAYLYKYDNRNRCIWKKLPGCDPVEYKYDRADRPVFTQDGEMKKKNLWMFTLYDAFSRVVMTGTTSSATDVSGTVAKATRSDNSGNLQGYTLPADISLPDAQVLTVNYYDDYTFRGKYGIPSGQLTDYQPLSGYGTQYTVSQKGHLTGTLTAQFDEHGNPGSSYLYSVMYYDERARVIQTKSNNNLGHPVKEFVLYTFTGQPKARRVEHNAGTTEQVTEVYTYDYDHAARLTTVNHSVNGQPTRLLTENIYDELGRISQVKRYNSYQSSLTNSYKYNIRSWVTDITGTHFTEHLKYYDAGNISQMDWILDGKKRTYNYAYDGLSRLTSATYTSDNTDELYATGYQYDKHGNILQLTREGKNNDGYGLVDNLSMSYQGNQVIKVTDTGTPVSLPESNTFEQGSQESRQYAYNQNGSMTQDLNKNITNISYNLLNLPQKIEIDGTTHTYRYAADGRKLQVKHGDSTRDYVGNLIYENGSLTKILVDGGYVQKEGNEYVYYFYLNDHLGNNNVVARQDGMAVQKNSYYPFGLPMAETTNAEQDIQPFKYNAKEFERKDGLKLFDYGARHYDGALGRFATMDPLTEKYYATSPYAYCLNNPIKHIDPDGRENVVVVGSQYANGAGNKLMFVNQGIRSLRSYSQSHPDESRSMVLFTGGYSKKQIARIEKSVAKYGGTLVQVNSAEEMINYINSKSTGSGDLSGARSDDKITNMDMFSHGVAGAVEFGYETNNWEEYRLNDTNVMNINSGAFKGTGSTITSYACRTALGTDIKFIGSDYGINPGNSLAQKMANASGAHVRAFPVRTDYQFTLGTWSERRFGFPNPKPVIETVDGAAFMPMGASHPVKAGSSPWGLYQGQLNFYPR